MVSIAVAGRSDDLAPEGEVIQLPLDVRPASAPARLDGESLLCLIEVSRALHRASVVLDGMGPGTLAQSWMGRGQEQDAHGNTPEGTEPDTVQGNISKAIALVDGLNAALTDLPAEASAVLPPIALHVPSISTGNGVHPIASEMADALRQFLERIAGDLNTSVIRSSFEGTLILQGALQSTSNPEVAQRINTVIELLDQNICDVRNIVFGFDSFGGATGAA